MLFIHLMYLMYNKIEYNKYNNFFFLLDRERRKFYLKRWNFIVLFCILLFYFYLTANVYFKSIFFIFNITILLMFTEYLLWHSCVQYYHYTQTLAFHEMNQMFDNKINGIKFLCVLVILITENMINHKL